MRNRIIGIMRRLNYEATEQPASPPKPDTTVKPPTPEPIKLNFLALKKDQKALCEICGRNGRLLCPTCRATYYCSMEHLKTDKSLHRVLCARIKEIRAPVPFCSSPLTRERVKKQYQIRLEEMYSYTHLAGKLALEEGSYEIAIAALFASAKTANLAFGESEKTIMPMTVLVECYIKKGDRKNADINLAECLRLEMVVKNVRRTVRAAIRHVEGLVMLSEQQIEEASYCFAEQIYQSTQEWGPTHFRTCSGYYNLGYIFLHKGKLLTAASFIRTAVDIWVNYVTDEIEIKLEQAAQTIHSVKEDTDDQGLGKTGIESDAKMGTSNSLYFSKPQEALDRLEGIRHLKNCSKLMDVIGEEFIKPLDYIRLDYALAGIYFIGNYFLEAKTKLVEAISNCEAYSITSDPIFKRLTRLSRECERKLFAAKKMAGAGHRPSPAILVKYPTSEVAD